MGMDHVYDIVYDSSDSPLIHVEIVLVVYYLLRGLFWVQDQEKVEEIDTQKGAVKRDVLFYHRSSICWQLILDLPG